MFIEKILGMIIPYIAWSLEGIGVLIVALAGVKGVYLFIKGGFNFGDMQVPTELAKGMSLSLSFLLAGEILLSVLVTTIESLIVLAGIAGLRVALTFVLHWELKSSEQSHGKVSEEIHG